jgi:hypothetical protein
VKKFKMSNNSKSCQVKNFARPLIIKKNSYEELLFARVRLNNLLLETKLYSSSIPSIP